MLKLVILTNIIRITLKEGRPPPRQLISPKWGLMSHESIMIYFKLHTYISLFDVDLDSPILINCSLYHCRAILKISLQSIYNLIHRQQNRQIAIY